MRNNALLALRPGLQSRVEHQVIRQLLSSFLFVCLFRLLFLCVCIPNDGQPWFVFFWEPQSRAGTVSTEALSCQH